MALRSFGLCVNLKEAVRDGNDAVFHGMTYRKRVEDCTSDMCE